MTRHTSEGNLRQKTKYVRSALAPTLIVCLLRSPRLVNGQTLWNPVNTTCNLHFGRGTVVGGKMFVDGGVQIDKLNYANGIDTPYPDSAMARWQNKHLWELDLSAKFNTSKPPWTAKAKPDDWNRHYNGIGGALWNFGDGTFYTFGGQMYSVYEGPPKGHRITYPYYTPRRAANGSIIYTYQLPPPSIHGYNVAVANWTSISLFPGIHRRGDIGYTQSKRNKVGYMFGGFPVVEQQNGGTNKDFVAEDEEGYDEYNWGLWKNTFSAYDFRKNTFNTSEIPDDIGATRRVILHSLDGVGDEGVLIAFGGISRFGDLGAMDNIWIHDIASSGWMNQAATGDIPNERIGSCSVVVPAPDLSSYQLYMFSGVERWGVYVLDMYVLSIPAFVWKKINLVNYPNKWGIADMACGLYEDRQFIIVPGQVNVSAVNNTFLQKCNMGTAVHVFDTYDWTFKAEFDPDNKGSKVSPAIVGLIGGDEKGNAKLQQPKAGWGVQELSRVFQIQKKLPTNVDGSTNSTNKTTSTSTDSPPHETRYDDQQHVDGVNESKSNSGAIAGGVVGGFVLLGLLFWWRKRQGEEKTPLPALGASGHSSRPPPELQAYEPPSELQAYESPQELQGYEPPEMGETR